MRVFATAAVLVSVAAVADPAVHAVVAAAGAQSAGVARPLDSARASARAASSGHAIPVPGATTATQTLTANPDGTLTLHQSIAPVRKRVGGVWEALDATLKRESDGSVSPATTTSALTLSGGGRGPLATMSTLGTSLSMWLPVTLPAPVLSGRTATYRNVLPGVDVQVRANVQGGFSDVLVVRSAAAAANPALGRLVLATRTSGLTVATGVAGDITATASDGHVIFAAETPFMWDSAAAPAQASAVTNPATGQRVDARSGLPLASTTAAPGEAARAAPVGVAVRAGRIILTPDEKLLTSPATVFPVYIDPTFQPPTAGSSGNEWTTVKKAFPGKSYWETPGLLHVGYQARNFPHFVARSFVNMPVPPQIFGATIITAQLNLTEESSASCTATPVQAWSTGPISPSTTCNHQPAWKSEADSQTVAHGYNSTCPAAGVGFNVRKTLQSAASGQWSQATFGLRAGNESDPDSWKQFANAVTMSITYDHAPSTPTGLSTSPATACPSSSPTVVGDGNVSLDVPVSDPDGGTLGVTIEMWDTATGAAFPGTPTDPQQLSASSGSTAVFIAHQADLEAAAAGAVTEFSWKAQVTDYYRTSPWSATCSFYFDPTHPGTPVVTAPASATISQPATFTVAPPASGPVPAAYSYQLNAGAPATVTASSSGDASITVVPTRSANTLTVTSLSAGGNFGGSATVSFNAAPAPPAADSDLNGDGKADLLTVGSSTNGLPPGLWLATGRGNGQVVTAATDIGVNGNGTGAGSPADFNGAQVITGHFGGTGLQDVLAYYPSNSGQANILLATVPVPLSRPRSAVTRRLSAAARSPISTGTTRCNSPTPAIHPARAMPSRTSSRSTATVSMATTLSSTPTTAASAAT